MGKPETRVPAMKLQIHIPEQTSSRRQPETSISRSAGLQQGMEVAGGTDKAPELLAFLRAPSCTTGASSDKLFCRGSPRR